MIRKHNLVLTMAVAVAVAAPAALATNGMNMQGYGPIAYGMGGASMAYDNGMAATMNNPATLAMMQQGDRLDVAFGVLAPDVDVDAAGNSVGSTGGPYMMPAVGWGRKQGALTFGFGMFAQGGMGTDFAGDSIMAAGSGESVRSELGVGRMIFPIAYEVDSNLKVGGSIDYVWAGLDLKMALRGSQFADLVGPAVGGANIFGTASGTMVNTFVGALTVPQAMCGGVPCLSGVNWVRFDFSNTNDFTGQAHGDGFAGKIGVAYKVNKQLSLGAAYHSKTSLSDLKADSATVSANVVGPATGGANVTANITGKITVKDFEWPAQIALGMAYQASDQLLVVADYKKIQWKDVMKNFKVVFEADATQADPMAAGFGLGGKVIDATLFQNWEDQNVFQLGGAYKVSNELTVRAGINFADSPIPSDYVNPLFPAIMEKHYTFGAGYALNKTATLDGGIAYAPQNKQTNLGGVTSATGGKSFQVMYSNRF